MDDISILVLEQFAEGDWRQYEDLLEEGKITVEECLALQFKLVKTSREMIIEYIEDKVEIRPGFIKFVDFCFQNKIELRIVSAGLDFIIENVQKHLNIDLPVIVPSTQFEDYLMFTFPNRYNHGVEDFKADEVTKWKKQGYDVIFIGDGGSDYFGSLHSKYVYTVKGKSLEYFLQKNGRNNVNSFTSFEQIIQDISMKFLSENN